MKKMKITLLHDNGKFMDDTEIQYFLWPPKLLIIDGKYYVRVSDMKPDQYQHEPSPGIYKTKKETENNSVTGV